MQFKTFLPKTSLRPYVEKYVYVEDDSHDGCWEQAYLPSVSECLNLNFNRGNLKTYRKKSGIVDLPYCYPSGPCLSRGSFLIRDEFKMFTVHFKPTCLFEIFRMPLRRLVENVISLDDFLGDESIRLKKQFFGCSKIEDAIDVIEHFLIKKISSGHDDQAIFLARSCIDRIVRCCGVLTMSDVQMLHCVTKKTLERSFNKVVGISPKMYSSIVRFNVARERLQNSCPKKMADFIFALGYIDQSHFVNDFKRFTGKSPRAYLNHWSQNQQWKSQSLQQSLIVS